MNSVPHIFVFFDVIVGVTIILTIYFAQRAQTKLQKKQEALPYAAPLVESICRAMCVADGRDPEGDGSVREYHTDDFPRKYKWELYRSQAYRFLMVYDVIKKYEEDGRYDGK
jgi:hypothetical protein